MNIFTWGWRKLLFVFAMTWLGDLIGTGNIIRMIILGYVFMFTAIILWNEWAKRQKELEKKKDVV